MIHFAFYSEDPAQLTTLIREVRQHSADLEYMVMTFQYPMDLLDFLNQSRPEKCSVFYHCQRLQSGLEAAKKVSSIRTEYRFTLICEEFRDAEELYRFGITYFIQPGRYADSFASCMNIQRLYYFRGYSRKLVLRSKSTTESFAVGEIDYVMSDKRKVIVCCGKNENSFYYKLDELEAMLGNGFLRCHQSYIVNMTCIAKFVEDGLYLHSGTYIPVSRQKYFAAKRRYLSFITGDSELVSEGDL